MNAVANSVGSVFWECNRKPEKPEYSPAFQTPTKVRIPPPPPIVKVLIILSEIDFCGGAECGEVVGALYLSKHLKRRNQ